MKIFMAILVAYSWLQYFVMKIVKRKLSKVISSIDEDRQIALSHEDYTRAREKMTQIDAYNDFLDAVYIVATAASILCVLALAVTIIFLEIGEHLC